MVAWVWAWRPAVGRAKPNERSAVKNDGRFGIERQATDVDVAELLLVEPVLWLRLLELEVLPAAAATGNLHSQRADGADNDDEHYASRCQEPEHGGVGESRFKPPTV
ncbi:hypothetical protein [Amycolatopsis samaneae]|uniref:Uncharacterized protein n=1 Tax=Amycolatopsis samaneae TaxID=664691 RepID=A0ABW5GI84_9PSEU